jgi:NADPH:quinone reductase
LIGTRVVTSTGGSGAYAERVAAALEGLISVPDPVTMPDAVALLADGRTAMALIAGAGIKAGETVLVEAAGGGVGSLLVQLARAAGAHVLAVAGGEPKLRLARELGAVAAVDYTRESWTSQVVDALSDHAGVADIRCIDVVFDGVGGEIGRAAFELLRPGGRHCMFGMASGSFAPIEASDALARGVTLIRGAPLSPQDMTRLTKAALDLAAAGNLRPVIGQTFPLARAADAHRAIEARSTLGKTLLLVQSTPSDPPL